MIQPSVKIAMLDLCAYCISPVRKPDFLWKPQRSRWRSIQDMTTTYCRLDQKGKQQLSLIYGERVKFSLWSFQSSWKIRIHFRVLVHHWQSCNAKAFKFGKMKPVGNIELWMNNKTGRLGKQRTCCIFECSGFWANLGSVMLISHPALLKWNASPLLCPRFSISAVITEAGQAKSVFIIEVFI